MGQNSIYGGNTGGVSVFPSQGCAGSGMGLLGAVFQQIPNTCPSTITQISVNFDRAVVSVGSTVNLAAAGKSSLYYNSGTVSCSVWSGTMTLIADIPSWQVSMNATCTQTGMPNVMVVGTMSGNQ
jgi:hypothetical protein